MNFNPLQPVWLAYQASPSCFKITERVISRTVQDKQDKLEFWKSDDMLNLLKSIVPSSNLIGQAKQILEYRDWVAHGKNPESHPSANITPKFAYNTLTEIVQLIQLN